MDNNSVYKVFADHGYSLVLRGFSALDRYWDLPPLPFVWALTDADIPAIARMFETLRFPGVDLADGAVDREKQCWYFRCIDDEALEKDGLFRISPASGESGDRPSYRLLSFFQDAATRRFQDPFGLYPLLRRLRDGAKDDDAKAAAASAANIPDGVRWWDLNSGAGMFRTLTEGAIIISRYTLQEDRNNDGRALRKIAAFPGDLAPDPVPQVEAQRVLLTSLMVSPRPDLGLELLKISGFVGKFWPELAQLDNVDHSKEFHPEGNVWKHTLETFRYRKPAGGGAYDLRLSLGLLLHDIGKPLSESSGARRFDGHAEIGARAARKFLERLEFEDPLVADVYFLVKNHMLPAALPRLPFSRTGEVLESPLFPTLLELYRCDESSSFKGLDGFYDSSAAYQAYLKNRRNPYRSADGKKQIPVQIGNFQIK
ncbi:MAG: HD domain-containing protein [Treponema sp.]|jgi:poly(A) polymerase|nr:HD domain-containing protein [Treponema sp.]